MVIAFGQRERLRSVLLEWGEGGLRVGVGIGDLSRLATQSQGAQW